MVYQAQVMEDRPGHGGALSGRSAVARAGRWRKKAGLMEKERKIFVYGGDGVEGVRLNGDARECCAPNL